MKIKVLPDVLINKIAAGEVVERPASVVRELVDNSVDAGATEITVSLEQGGQGLIKVVDDGCGMARDDAILSFERHATSKIQSDADLDAIRTMGFRGEALASIASIARVTLTTKAEGAAAAIEVGIDGGVLRGVREVAANRGTSIEVRSIFFNTPARKKFLRSPKTEISKIKQWLASVALAHPGLRFRLLSDGQELLNLPKASSIFERGERLLPAAGVRVVKDSGTVLINGIVLHPAMAQGEAGALTVLVNRRVVSDRMILRAVREGFDSTLKEREFPFGFISLEVPPEEVDVNVHPQKSEVRFRNGQGVFVVVREAVLRAVRDLRSPQSVAARPSGIVPRGEFLSDAGGWRSAESSNVTGSYLESGSSRSPMTEGSGAIAIGYASPVPTPSRAAVVQERAAPVQDVLPLSQQPQSLMVRERATVETEPFAAPLAQPFRYRDITLIGQTLGCYLLGEFQERLYCIDMHAAHERYNYNLIRNRFRDRDLPSQQLLIPEVVTLSERGVERCLEEQDGLAALGFEIEQFGSHQIAIRAAPALLKLEAVATVVKEIAALGEQESSGQSVVETRLDHIAARLACHASVRSGEQLVQAEAYALLAALDTAEFSAACPHGRPVITSFSRSEVEQWFGRDR